MTPLMSNTKQVAHFRIGIDEKKKTCISAEQMPKWSTESILTDGSILMTVTD